MSEIKWAGRGQETTRVISANDMHVIAGQFLDAAKELHIAMCLFGDDNRGQTHLNAAMFAILVGAEQCRQLHAQPKFRLAVDEEEEPS